MYKKFRELDENTSSYIMNIQAGVDVDKNFNFLLEEFQPIIQNIIRLMKNNGSIENADLEQEAAVVLWKCCHTYKCNYERGGHRSMFCSYFYSCAVNSLSEFVYKYQTSMVFNKHEKERTKPLREFSKSFFYENGRFPTYNEYVEEGFSEKLTERFLNYITNTYNNGLELDEIDKKTDCGHSIEDMLIEIDERNKIHQSIDDLDEPYRTIIKSYFFENKTNVEIGKKLGLKENTIRKHKKKAIEILKDNLIDCEIE